MTEDAGVRGEFITVIPPNRPVGREDLDDWSAALAEA